MSDGEKEQEEGQETKKKGGLIPVILGAALVIGASAGVVIMTAPPPEEKEEEKVDFDSLPERQWIEKIAITFNPLNSKNSLCKLGFFFAYKAMPDPMLEEAVITPNLRKAKSKILIFLKGMSKDDIEGSHGAEHVRKKLLQLLEESIFSEGQGIISDVFIEDLLFT